MARSRFSAWIDLQSDENAEVIRRGRPMRERLMRVFDRQSLATWLFYAILTLTFVSFATTALALYELLIAGSNQALDRAGLFDPITRGVIAAGTTLGIQIIAVVLSLFFGGQLVRLFTASHVPLSLPRWRRIATAVSVRGLQVVGVVVVGVLLAPFLAFSIAFSYATFHHTLETDEEIARTTLNDVPELFEVGRARIQQAILREIEARSASWSPASGELGAGAQEASLNLVAQLGGPLFNTRQRLRRVLDTEDGDALPDEERNAIQENIGRWQTEIRAAERSLLLTEKRLAIVNGQTNWEHGLVFDFFDANPEDPEDLDSGGGLCTREAFRTSVARLEVAAIAGILRTILEREEAGLTSFALRLEDENDREQARLIRDALITFIEDDSTTVESLSGLTADQLDKITYPNLQATLFGIVDALEGGPPNCSRATSIPGRGVSYFDQLRRQAIGYLRDRREAEATIATRRSDIERAQQMLRDDNIRRTDQGRRALTEALLAEMTRLENYAATVPEFGDDAMAGLSGAGLEGIETFAVAVDEALLSVVESRLSGSLGALTCSNMDRPPDPPLQSVEPPQAGDCLLIARLACQELDSVLRNLQEAANVDLENPEPIRGLICQRFAPSSTTYQAIGRLHIARIRVAEVELDNPELADPEPVLTLRRNAELALSELRVTRPVGAREMLSGTYTGTLADLSQAISNLDGRATVRRSWQRMILMLQRDMGNALSDLSGVATDVIAWLASPFMWVLGINEAESSSVERETSWSGGITYIYEFYAFAIAVMIDIMIVLMAICVVILRRSTLIGVEAHEGVRFDEQVIESALSGISREDPTIFSTIVQHFKLTGSADYPVTINISRITGSPRRARARRILALLGNLVRKTTEDIYELRPAAQVYLQYLAADERHGVKANPEDLEGEPA